MPDVEIDLRDDLYVQIQQLADEDFLNEDEAVEQLLSAGLEAYRTDEPGEERRDISEEFADDMWDTAGDPAGDVDGPDRDDRSL